MPSTKYLTVPQIVARDPRAWFALSKQQKAFVIEYISHGMVQGHYDTVAAGHTAYPKVKASKVWASRLMVNRRVKKVLALHFGLSEAEVLLADIKALIKRSHRKNANLDILVAPWLRASAALEGYVAQEKSRG